MAQNEFYGEFLINAQGEDVVAGVRTPEPVAKLEGADAQVLRRTPEGAQASSRSTSRMCRISSSPSRSGKFFMLQTRNGKRTAAAALKFSIDMVKEKLIDWQTAILRNPADQLEQLLAPIFDPSRSEEGPESSPPVFRRARAQQPEKSTSTPNVRSPPPRRAKRCLLVRVETSPEDLRGMIAAEGILTARGGVSSHAASVARQMGKVCVCGAAAVSIDYDERPRPLTGTFTEGDFLSIDGTSGAVYAGQIKTAPVRDHRRSDQRRQSRARHGKIQATSPSS
jgi:pyruvate,orthophosphate dikinase